VSSPNTPGLRALQEGGRLSAVLEAVTAALDEACHGFDDNAAGAAAAYEKRCALLGNRVKIRLLPKGETRGTARRVDRSARLELESPSGMVERITVDQLGALDVV
jgi:biotin-(acetyl-CoA carboxylase) ligase